MRPVSILAACASLALLASCGDKKKEDDERTASGEVLQGTISDAMIPLETVQSQPPLAKPAASASGAAAEDPGAAEDAEPAAQADAPPPPEESDAG